MRHEDEPRSAAGVVLLNHHRAGLGPLILQETVIVAMAVTAKQNADELAQYSPAEIAAARGQMWREGII